MCILPVLVLLSYIFAFVPCVGSLLCSYRGNYTYSTMKYLLVTLASIVSVSAHGYVSWGIFGNKNETFWQPYQDPYMNPKRKTISRPIQGNGPVQDVTLSDLQCGGYAAGGFPGSEPAALHAEIAAGAEVELGWTLWPESHIGVSKPH
jgi:hypothetical protein